MSLWVSDNIHGTNEDISMENLKIFNIGRVVLAVIYISILVAVALQDRKTRKIPDRLALSLGFCGLFSIPFFMEITMMERVEGVFSVSLLLLAITFLVPGSFGGGDIKLMMAAGIFLGVKRNIEAFVIALLLAGIYCTFLLVIKQIERKSKIAFAPFLCSGIVVEVWILLN